MKRRRSERKAKEKHTPRDTPHTRSKKQVWDEVASEIIVDPRSFHHWSDLLPELRTVVVNFLDEITLHVFSMTCSTYGKYGYSNTYTVNNGILTYVFISRVCRKETPSRYLLLTAQYAIRLRNGISRDVEDFFEKSSNFQRFAIHLARNQRFPWIEALINSTKIPVNRSFFNSMLDGALVADGIEAFQWVTKHPRLSPYWAGPFPEHRIAVVSNGNFPLADHLLKTYPPEDIYNHRVNALHQAWRGSIAKFFASGQFLQDVEWQQAWETLQDMLFTLPLDLSAIWLANPDFGLTMTIWPYLKPCIQDKAQASPQFLKSLSEHALYEKGIAGLEAMERNRIPLDFLAEPFHISYGIFPALSNDDALDKFIWMWKRGCFECSRPPKNSTKPTKFHSILEQCMRVGYQQPDKVPYWEHMLKTYPIKGGDLMIQAAKLGAAAVGTVLF